MTIKNILVEKEYTEKIKDCLLQPKKIIWEVNEKCLGDNDYEYVNAISNGEKNKNSPNNINKINSLNLMIFYLYITNVYKKSYKNPFGTFAILHDEVKIETTFKNRNKVNSFRIDFFLSIIYNLTYAYGVKI